MKSPKKVFVTGANSFLGWQLCQTLLQRGAEVHGYCRHPRADNSIRWHAGDIADLPALTAALALAQPEQIFHLAADTRRARDWALLDAMFRTNVIGATNLMTAARQTPARAIVAVGSFEEYGDQQPPFCEDMLPRPVSPYGLTKALAALTITSMGREGVPATVVRFPVPYGPGQTADLFIGGACAALREGKRFPMSPGEQTRDFLYVEDGIEALLLATDNIQVCRGEILNACSGVAITLREAIQLIGKIAGVKDFADVGALRYRPREQMQYFGTHTKITQLLGWSARTSLSEGIRRTLAIP